MSTDSIISNSTTTTTTITPSINNINSSKSSSLPALVQLERLLHRAGLLLASTSNSKENLSYLIQYHKQAEKLLEIVDASENNDEMEYEWENRRRWIDNQMNLLAEQLEEVSEEISKEEIGQVEVKLEEPVIEHAAVIEEILPAKIELPKAPIVPIKSTKPEPKESSSPNGTIKFSDTLQSDHDSLTTDLISTVRLIKRNNLALRQIVEEDDKTLDTAALLLADNTGKMGKEGGNLKKYSRSAWGTTWKLLGLMLVVMITFLFMYLFIKVTRK